jgi:protein-S-isoprenylcysteine O-methyltransferase Ste14
VLDRASEAAYNAPRLGECSSRAADGELEATDWKVEAMALKTVYRWRGLLTALPVIFSILCFAGEYENDLVTWPLGVLLFLAGWALRMWAQKHLGYRLKIKRIVTTSGPYALIRNPIYIANTLVILGAVVMSEVIWMIPVTLIWCAVTYSFVVRYEEARLAVKYGGEYLDYRAVVPRWVPRMASVIASAHFRSSPGQILLAELHVVLIIAAPLVKEFIVAPFLE